MAMKDSMPQPVKTAARSVFNSLNFYRVHLLCFTFIPLILSAIFYAANGQYKIPFIDCLLLCFSAFCVTGLATTNLSQLTIFQQFLLFAQTIFGSLIFVSLIMIYVRMYFFRAKFKHVIAEQQKNRSGFSLTRTLTAAPHALKQRFTRDPGVDERGMGMAPPTMGSIHTPTTSVSAPTKKKKGGPINKDMIKRIDGGGVGLINPMGWYDGNTPTHTPGATPPLSPRSQSPEPHASLNGESHKLNTFHTSSDPGTGSKGTSDESKKRSLDETDSGEADLGNSPALLGSYDLGPKLSRARTTESITGTGTALAPPSTEAYRRPYAGTPVEEDAFPRSKTIAFDEPDDGFNHELNPGEYGRANYPFPRVPTTQSNGLPWTATGVSGGFPRTYSLRPTTSRKVETKFSGFGGFPTPIEMLNRGFSKAFPRVSTKLTETVTMPRTNTITGRGSIHSEAASRQVPYISFSAVVGRNSNFKGLTEEQMDELGGVEYRALKLLFWIVLCYWLFLPIAGATIIAPYIAAQGRYDHIFENQYKHVRIPWFAFFQAYSGFTNLGMSLVDLSVLPFQGAYLMNCVVALLILFGNTCYPILLRFIIWVMWKTVPAESSISESLKFLLDHPRRCFVYLFPSTTTWFLAFVVILLTCIDFFTFMVLDIGTPAIEAIPIGTRIAAGLFQSVAVRAAGFAIVPMNSLAPAVKVMFVIMMYISVYPIAMSVRSTNVYEERALGLYDEDEDEEELEEEEEKIARMTGANAVAKYLGFHARRQLAFDMWWIVGALWLVCIIERPNLNDKEKWEYMNVFNIIFELVSAYGTVGLSLGVTYDNFSLVGGMRKLSKLVIIIVLLRGRHRGLPVAIDRAVMLPTELEQSEMAAMEDRLRRMRSRMSFSEASAAFPRTYTNATNQTNAVSSDGDPAERQRGRTGSISTSPKLAPMRRDSSNSAATAAGTRLARDRSPSVRQRERDRSPSMTRIDTSPNIRRHQRSMSSGSTSADSPNTATGLTFALGRGGPGADPMPPVTSKLSNLPGLSPLPESDMSRRGTVAEPEEMSTDERTAVGSTDNGSGDNGAGAQGEGERPSGGLSLTRTDRIYD